MKDAEGKQGCCNQTVALKGTKEAGQSGVHPKAGMLLELTCYTVQMSDR